MVASGLLPSRFSVASSPIWLLPVIFLLVLPRQSRCDPPAPRASDQPPPASVQPGAEPAQTEVRYKGKRLSQWIKQLEEQDEKARNEAIEAVSMMGPAAAAAVPSLLPFLRTDRPDLIARTALALRRMGPAAAAAVPTLVEILRDKNVEGAYVIPVLADIGPNARPAIPALLQLYHEESFGKPLLPASILKDLGKIDPADPAVRRTLLEAIRHGYVELQMIKGLKPIGPEVVPILIEAMHRIGPGAGHIADCLAELRPESVLALTELLERNDAQLRQPILHALTKIGPEARPAIPALVEALKEEAPIHTDAAQALQAIGVEALPALREAVKHKDKNVRSRATLALGHFGAAAVPALTEALAIRRTKRFSGAPCSALAKHRTSHRRAGPDGCENSRGGVQGAGAGTHSGAPGRGAAPPPACRGSPGSVRPECQRGAGSSQPGRQ